VQTKRLQSVLVEAVRLLQPIQLVEHHQPLEHLLLRLVVDGGVLVLLEIVQFLQVVEAVVVQVVMVHVQAVQRFRAMQVAQLQLIFQTVQEEAVGGQEQLEGMVQVRLVAQVAQVKMSALLLVDQLCSKLRAVEVQGKLLVEQVEVLLVGRVQAVLVLVRQQLPILLQEVVEQVIMVPQSAMVETEDRELFISGGRFNHGALCKS
jgi:hypothetical protein